MRWIKGCLALVTISSFALCLYFMSLMFTKPRPKSLLGSNPNSLDCNALQRSVINELDANPNLIVYEAKDVKDPGTAAAAVLSNHYLLQVAQAYRSSLLTAKCDEKRRAELISSADYRIDLLFSKANGVLIAATRMDQDQVRWYTKMILDHKLLGDIY